MKVDDCAVAQQFALEEFEEEGDGGGVYVDVQWVVIAYGGVFFKGGSIGICVLQEGVGVVDEGEGVDGGSAKGMGSGDGEASGAWLVGRSSKRC